MSSLGQVQLVKWSLPTFALILGLLWYKRRRVDRVDPGGASKIKGDTGGQQQQQQQQQQPQVKQQQQCNGSTPNGAVPKSLCDSGIHTDDSFSLNTSTSSPIEDIISPRKVSENLDIPNRRSSSTTHSASIELSNTPWYDDVETPETKEIILGSNPSKSGIDYLAKSKSNAGSKNSSIMEEVIQEEAKVVIANNEVQASKTDFKVCDKKQESQQEQVIENGDEKKQRQALSERDSANHSPVSGVLEGSVTDEARSEGSTDSGKGGSIKGRIKDTSRTVYEFAIPMKLVGKLIGRNGKSLQHVRKKANVDIVVKRHPFDPDSNLCVIEGTPDCISKALDVIRNNFPEKTYPQLTLEQFVYEQALNEEIPWVPELMQLSLIEGVNNDVFVSHVVKPNHFFIQLPTHPTYPMLRFLDDKMTELYEAVESPSVPDELSKGMIVVAKLYEKWVRVFIEKPDPTGEHTLARLVDHGGYWTFNNADMRKIRSDFLTLPFQAIEVFLANIQPIDDEWSQEAFDVVTQIGNGVVGQAQIVGYVDCSTFINLYFNLQKHGVISIADELIARGLAKPMSLEDVVPQEVLQTA